MNNNSARVRLLCQSALIAALYAALTLAVPVLSFSMMQLRISEALTVLPVLYPPATLGLTVGCALANLVGFLRGPTPSASSTPVWGRWPPCWPVCAAPGQAGFCLSKPIPMAVCCWA